MQTLGRLALAGQASYQVHPLVGLSALGLLNLDDGSVLLGPSAGWSATGSATVSLGLFTGLGTEAGGVDPLGSEYGSVPAVGYAALTWYF